MADPSPISYADRSLRQKGNLAVARVLGISGCIVGVGASAIPLWLLIPFYSVPVGTYMRPMALVAALFGAAILGLVTLPLTATCLYFGWRFRSTRWLALICLLIGLWSIFGGFAVFDWIVAVRHFVLED